MPISEDEVLSLMEPTPSPADLQPPPAPISEEEVLGIIEEEETNKDKRLRSIFEMPEGQPLQRQAEVLKLAREANLPSDIAEARFDEFKASWESSRRDPRRWRTENPELARIALDRPELGQVVVKDEQLSILSQGLNKAIDVLGWIDEAIADPDEDIAKQNETAIIRTPLAAERAAAREAAKVKPRRLAVSQDNKVRALQEFGLAGRLAVPFIRGYETKREMDVARMQFDLMVARTRGQDTYELEKRIHDAKRELVPRDYGESALEQVGTDVAQAMASNLAVIEDAGKAGAVGAVVGGVVGGAMSRSLAGARAGALRGISIFGQAGMALGSFRLEAGSAYAEMLDAKTDDGRPLKEEEARGAALMYGALAAGVEVGSLSVLLKSFGPLGEALTKGTGKAFMSGLMRDASFRAIAAEAGKAWLKAGASEGAEEAIQTALQDAITYFARSHQAGAFQTTGGVDVSKALAAGEKGFIGGLGIGAAGMGVNITTQAIARDQAVQSGRQVAALAQLGDSPSVKAAPEVVAQMVADQTGKSGAPVTHLYVDPGAFMRLFQSQNEDPTKAAEELLGPEGPRALQEAVSTGQRLEVPVATYLEKWGTKPVAQALVEDTTTAPDRQTPREVREEEARIIEEAQRIETEDPAAADPLETQMIDELEKSLAESGPVSREQVRAALTPMRAFMRTMAARHGRTVSEQFGNVSIQAGEAETPVPASALRQDPRTLAAMREFFGKLDAEGQKKALMLDRNTGLLNARGFRELPRDPARPFLAEFEVEGGKFLNDAHGHGALDGALRVMAVALRESGIQDGTKMGGSIRSWVTSPQQAQDIAVAMSKALGGGLQVTTGVAEGRESLSETFEEAAKAHRAEKDLGIQQGRLGHRKGAPRAFMEGAPAIAFEEGMPGVPLDSPEAKAALAEAKTRATPAAQRITGLTTKVTDTPLGETHAKAFEQLGDQAFSTIYVEPETGLLTDDGLDLAERVSQPKAYASADLRGLAPMNKPEHFTKEGADVLLEDFGTILAEVAHQMGIDAGHPHGDEYTAFADDPAKLDAMFTAVRKIADKRVFFRDLPDGRIAVQVGLHFVHGTGDTYDFADREALPKAKREQGDVPGPRILSPEEYDREAARLRDRGGFRFRDVEEAIRERRARRDEEARLRAEAQEVAKTRLNQESRERFHSQGRGYTDFLRKGTELAAKIVLNKDADVSTILHESGHVFLEMMRDMAGASDIPPRVKEDWATLTKWLGVEPGGTIEREHHERFARAIEAYFYEGKAPTPALTRVFTRLRLWLKSVYRSVRALDVDLNPEVRDVFNRMFATDEEIARTQAQMGLQPVFRSPEEAGMTPEEWQKYLEAQEDATSHAADAARARVLRDKLRETEAWWKREEKELFEKALEEFDQMPASRALAYIRKGELVLPDGRATSNSMMGKLDRQAVEALIGKERAKEEFSGRMKKDGESPDDVAELFGYGTGAEMLQAILAHPEREAWAQQQASLEMQDRHPDILQERDAMRELAGKTLHSDFSVEVLLKELRALRSRAGQRGDAPVDAIKRAAQAIVEKRSIRSLDAGRALQAERSAAEKALRAAAAGDFAQAYVYQQQRLLNHYLYRELAEAREQRDEFETLATQLSKDKARARLGKGSPTYRDAVDQVLEALGLKAPTQRDQPPTSIGEMVNALEANGETIAFDSDALGQLIAKPRDWRSLTVAELRNVVSALKNIKQAAINRTTAIVEGKRVDKAELVTKLVAAAAKNLPEKGPVASSVPAMSLAQQGLSIGATVDGWLLRPETMIDWLGGGAADSIWAKAVVRPLQDAKAKAFDLGTKVAERILKKLEEVPQSVRARFYEKVDGEALFPGHRRDIPPPTRRFELFMMFLNSGTASSKQRLLEGRGISETELRAALDLLTKEEMDAAQEIGDAFESLWPEIRALEERDTGLPPEKLVRLPIQTRHGTYAGFYFPAVYDRRVAITGEKQAAQTLADLMDPSYTRPGTSHSHTKKRAQNFADVIALDPSIIPAHIAQVVHDLAFRETVKSVGGLILHPDIQATLKRHLGDERASTMLTWLKDVGQMRGAAIATHGNIAARLSSFIRSNAVTNAIGYSLRIAMGDMSNFAVAVAGTELTTRFAAGGFADFLRAPRAMRKLALEKSGELRLRDDHVTRALRLETEKLSRRNFKVRAGLDALREHAFTMFEWTERFTLTPIWLGAYKQGLKEGRVEREAVAFADRVVRQVSSSHSPVDQSKLLRDKGMLGSSLMLHGYMNAMYSRMRDVAHPLYLAVAEGDTVAEKALAAGRVLPRVSGRLIALFAAYGAFAELLSGRGPEEGDGDDEAERWMAWFARKVFMAPVGALPFISGPVESWILGKKPSVRAAPQFEMIAQLISTITALGKEELTRKDVEAMARTLGALTGLPGNQAVRTFGYAFDVEEGNESPADPFDVLGGVIYGKKPGQPENPASVASKIISGGQ